MDMESLQTFITLAELKNFTKTAEQHFVVQSTVTNRISELEQEFGKQLFIRDKKHVVLTPEGELLLSYAKRIVELNETAQDEISRLQKYSSRLSIGSVNTVYDCYLAPLLSEFMRRNQKTAVKVQIGHSNHLLRLLRDDIIDVCYSFIPIHAQQFLCEPFRKDRLVLVTGQGNDLFPEGLPAERIQELPFLYCDYVDKEGNSILKELFPKRHPFVFEVDSGMKLLPFLEAGIGYSYLPETLVQPKIEAGTLNRIKVTGADLPEIESFMVANKRKLGASALREWMEVISMPASF